MCVCLCAVYVCVVWYLCMCVCVVWFPCVGGVVCVCGCLCMCVWYMRVMCGMWYLCACVVSACACMYTRVCIHSDSKISFQAVLPLILYDLLARACVKVMLAMLKLAQTETRAAWDNGVVKLSGCRWGHSLGAEVALRKWGGPLDKGGSALAWDGPGAQIPSVEWSSVRGLLPEGWKQRPQDLHSFPVILSLGAKAVGWPLVHWVSGFISGLGPGDC